MRKAVVVAQLIAAGVVLNRLRSGATRPPLVRVDMPTDKRVSVIVPARNEAKIIGRCISSIFELSKPFEVIVVNDNSSDATADVATQHGAMVIDAKPLPDGWIGKPWALQAGLEVARGEIVLCLDADVALTGDAVSAVAQTLEDNDVVTFSPKLLTASPLEQALSASMVATLVYRFGPVGQPSAAPDRTIGNGQCLAMDRVTLLDHGGFELSAGNMTDDIALVRALAARGMSVAFLDGNHLLETHMYTSAKETWDEWPRSLPMNDVTPIHVRALDLITLWLTMALPLLRVVTNRATWVDRVLLLQRFGIAAAVLSAFKAPLTGALLAPLVDVPVVARITWTTIRPVRAWRGRQY